MQWTRGTKTNNTSSIHRPSFTWRLFYAFTRIHAAFAPTVGQELERAGVPNRTLDLDGRFEGLSGFVRYDVTRPHWLGEEFGIILFDPPFFNAAPFRLLSMRFGCLQNIPSIRSY